MIRLGQRALQLAGGRGLASAWAYVFVGFMTARVLGFLFSVAATRLLSTEDFGRFTFALTVSTVLAVFLSTLPTGLSGFLVRTRGDREAQASYATNWLAAVGAMLVVSLLLTPLVGAVAGFPLWLMLGIGANQIGIAVLETYREVQRGADLYFEMAASYVVSNVLQLVVILAMGAAGVRDPGLYLVVYGLSPLAMLLLLEGVRPARIALTRRALSRARVAEIARFALPLSAQAVCFTVWSSADVVLLERYSTLEAVGQYGVAKTMSLVVLMPAATLASVVGPRGAVLEPRAFRSYLVQTAGLTAAVTLPIAVGVAVFGRLAVTWIFGDRYAEAAAALPWLALAMSAWAVYQVASRLWIGHGRTAIDFAATAVGMTVTLAVGWFAVPATQLTGAAFAFCLGSVARLVVVAAYSSRAAGASARPAAPGERRA